MRARYRLSLLLPAYARCSRPNTLERDAASDGRFGHLSRVSSRLIIIVRAGAGSLHLELVRRLGRRRRPRARERGQPPGRFSDFDFRRLQSLRRGEDARRRARRMGISHKG